jgi:hypothetical protein
MADRDIGHPRMGEAWRSVPTTSHAANDGQMPLVRWSLSVTGLQLGIERQLDPTRGSTSVTD